MSIKGSVIVTLVVLFMAGVHSGSAFAAHPLTTDDTGTQGKAKLQIELNSELNCEKASEEGITIKTTNGELSANLSYGITDTVDIVFGFPYQWSKVEVYGMEEGEHGVSDASIELKWKLYEREGLSFAIKPGLTFPTGNHEKGFGSGKLTSGLVLITTKELERGAIHLNFGYTRNENKVNEKENIWNASIAGEAEITANLKFVADIVVEANPDKAGDTPPNFILGGLIYSISESVDLDIGYRYGLTETADDYSILAGMTVRF